MLQEGLHGRPEELALIFPRVVRRTEALPAHAHERPPALRPACQHLDHVQKNKRDVKGKWGCWYEVAHEFVAPDVECHQFMSFRTRTED